MGRHKSNTYDADTTFSTTFSRKHSAEQVPAPLDWAGWIIRPEDPKYQCLSDIPNGCGIYAWYSRNGDLLYIGRSVCMNNRLRRHHMGSNGGRQLSYRLVPQRYLAGVEMAHIKTLGPYWNGAEEAAGLPFWEEMRAAIDWVWRDTWPQMRERVYAHESAIVEAIAARL